MRLQISKQSIRQVWTYEISTYAVVKLKREKYSRLNGIRTNDLCDTGAVLYQLSYQATTTIFYSFTGR